MNDYLKNKVNHLRDSRPNTIAEMIEWISRARALIGELVALVDAPPKGD